MIKLKGLILAGGYGSRLMPLTKSISKHVIPVYDKPMIYYPLATLMNAGIKEIAIISTPRDLPRYKDMFSDGSGLGLNISYITQSEPRGIAEAFILAYDFIDNSNICLILGDNIFYGKDLNVYYKDAIDNLKFNFSTIFSVQVNNPNDFGVIKFDKEGKIQEIIEKPKSFLSNSIVSGLYFFTNNVIEIAKKLVPSKRGELEISDINNHYLRERKLKLIKLNADYKWFDTGTYNSLIETSKFFKDLEDKTTKKYACIEEIALNHGYINKIEFLKIAESMISSDYGAYLKKIYNNL